MTDDIELFLIRHGETVWNRERRVQGRRDSPLTWRGIEQARRLGRRLRVELHRDTLYELHASPLGRTWQTAVIMAETLDLAPGSITHDDRLVEMAWGDWDGLTAEEIDARDPELWQARIDDRWTKPPPGGGETQQDLFDRAAGWLASLSPGSRLIVVTHGAFGRAVRCAYLRQPPAVMLDLDQPQDAFFRLARGQIERIDVDD